jgi:hypothetical protein
LLKFILSDGSKTIEAIEYRSMPSLNQFDLLPGTKIILKGQINFFSQMLFLSSGNIQVLGGQVPDIGTSVNLIQVLQKMMYVLVI